MNSNEVDFLCLECPLSRCDQSSLWCMVKLLTKPNAAQMKLLGDKPAPKKRSKRYKYWKKRYDANREVFKARALARYHESVKRGTTDEQPR